MAGLALWLLSPPAEQQGKHGSVEVTQVQERSWTVEVKDLGASGHDRHARGLRRTANGSRFWHHGRMSVIYLIRHGQASFGTDNYDQLSAVGREQSAILGSYFAALGEPIHRIYTGTLATTARDRAARRRRARAECPAADASSLRSTSTKANRSCTRSPPR